MTWEITEITITIIRLKIYSIRRLWATSPWQTVCKSQVYQHYQRQYVFWILFAHPRFSLCFRFSNLRYNMRPTSGGGISGRYAYHTSYTHAAMKTWNNLKLEYFGQHGKYGRVQQLNGEYSRYDIVLYSYCDGNNNIQEVTVCANNNYITRIFQVNGITILFPISSALRSHGRSHNVLSYCTNTIEWSRYRRYQRRSHRIIGVRYAHARYNLFIHMLYYDIFINIMLRYASHMRI